MDRPSHDSVNAGIGVISLNLVVLNVVGALVLAMLTLTAGVFFWPKFIHMCREMGIALPPVTVAMLQVRPVGWFLIFAGVLGLRVVKEIFVKSGTVKLAVNSITTLAGLAYLFVFVLANSVLLLPIIKSVEGV